MDDDDVIVYVCARCGEGLANKRSKNGEDRRGKQRQSMCVTHIIITSWAFPLMIHQSGYVFPRSSMVSVLLNLQMKRHSTIFIHDHNARETELKETEILEELLTRLSGGGFAF